MILGVANQLFPTIKLKLPMAKVNGDGRGLILGDKLKWHILKLYPMTF
jgi:hypothetical protein